jgi:glycosyltransferase involved in cell wall biosynthesis
MRTLYISYFGLREPLVQSQVLPYLLQLSRGGIDVGLLTFEPNRRTSWARGEARDWCERLQARGIRWTSLPYHKTPSLPATVYDIAAGGWMAARLVRRHGYDVVHARSHVAAAMGALAKRLTGCRLIFDIRGFNPEEYVDAGVWPRDGLNFRLAKRIERHLLAASDGFVVLTERARDILFPGRSDTDSRGRPVEVIPCCVDLGRFEAATVLSRERTRQDLGVDGRRVFVYVGSLGKYYLLDEMVDFLATAHRQDASTFSLILTRSPHKLIRELFENSGIPMKDFLIRGVSPELIPSYLGAADIGLSFKMPNYSAAATSPTKVAEYLANGLPVISNAGIGDTDKMIESDRVGVILRHFHRDAYLSALGEVDELRRDPDLVARCVATATSKFDLETIGGARYRRLYSRLLKSAEPALALATDRC